MRAAAAGRGYELESIARRIDAPGRPRHDAFAVFAVGCEYSMKSSQIQPWPGDQSGQPRHEVQRLQHNVGRAITKRVFVAVHDLAPAIDTAAS